MMKHAIPSGSAGALSIAMPCDGIASRPALAGKLTLLRRRSLSVDHCATAAFTIKPYRARGRAETPFDDKSHLDESSLMASEAHYQCVIKHRRALARAALRPDPGLRVRAG